MLNNALVSLNSLEHQTNSQNCIPVSFSFFRGEFAMFSEAAMTNSEVAGILRDLCESLKSMGSEQTTRDHTTTRRSIADPHAMKLMGPRTTSTSAKVDRRAHVQRTRMVDHFQANVLDRTKKPSKQKRQHTCSICRGQGHHPQTCQQILSSENAERANLFFQQLIQKNKVQGYLDLLAKRTSQSFSRTVAERIQVVKARSRVFEGNEPS